MGSGRDDNNVAVVGISDIGGPSMLRRRAGNAGPGARESAVRSHPREEQARPGRDRAPRGVARCLQSARVTAPSRAQIHHPRGCRACEARGWRWLAPMGQAWSPDSRVVASARSGGGANRARGADIGETSYAQRWRAAGARFWCPKAASFFPEALGCSKPALGAFLRSVPRRKGLIESSGSRFHAPARALHQRAWPPRGRVADARRFARA